MPDASQMTSLDTSGIGTINNTYNNRGLIAETSLPNGIKTTWAHDNAGQVTGYSLKNATNAEIYKKDYSYSPIGNISQKGTTGSLPSLDDFTYDPLSQLTSQKKNSDGTVTNAYEYSANGNLTNNNSVLQSFDDSGKILSSGNKTFSYDDRGNRVGTTDSVDANRDATYGWDTTNLLTSVNAKTNNGSNVDIDYTYSADGLLATRTKDGQNTNSFVWDTSGSIPLLLDDGVNEYIYSTGRTPIAQVAKSNGVATYLHTDSIGSVTASTDNNGQILASTDYSPYGVNLGLTVSPYGYAGEWTDPDTKHSYLRARWLDTTTGTFLSRDPAVQTTGDAYGYVAGNPLNLIDPLGLDPFALMDSKALQNISDFAAGFGDSLTMGGTSAIRDLFGANSVVNTCSTIYTTGEWTGNAASFVTPGGIIKQTGAFSKIFSKAIAKLSRTEKDPGMAYIKSFQKQGGSYGELADATAGVRSIQKVEINHMPANSMGRAPGKNQNQRKRNGGAIMMTEADHALTRNWGSRAKVLNITEANVSNVDIIRLDIADVRQNFGKKYDTGINQMIDYYKTLGINV